MVKKLSKVTRIGGVDYRYVADFARKRGVTFHRALHLICKLHAAIALSPIEKAQRRIIQASNELNHADLRLFLARVNQILDLAQKKHSVGGISGKLDDWIKDAEKADAVLEAEKKKGAENRA